MRIIKISNIKYQILKREAFTLIELLIVIALLGALAVGLLAAVDPFEQLKKGTDTSRRNTVVEFFNASIRYYATNSRFPWTSATPPTGSSLDNFPTEISALEAAGELKAGFSSLAGGIPALSKMYVTSTTSAGSESVAVCFIPESKSFQFDQNTKYDSVGAITAECRSQVGATGNVCYWCMK